MNRIVWAVLLWLLVGLHCKTHAQTQQRITDDNINLIPHWKVLFAAQKEAHNRNIVPSLISKLAHPQKYTLQQQIYWVDSLVAFKSHKAMSFVFDMLCRPIAFDTITPITQLALTLIQAKGYQALNKHFLNDSISNKLDSLHFNQAVYSAIRAKYSADHFNGWYLISAPKPMVALPVPSTEKRLMRKNKYCKSAFLLNDTLFQSISSFQTLLLFDSLAHKSEITLIQKLLNHPTLSYNEQHQLLLQLASSNSNAIKKLFYMFAAWPITIIDDLNEINFFSSIFSTHQPLNMIDSFWCNNQFLLYRNTKNYSNTVLQYFAKMVGSCYACAYKTAEELQIENMKKYNIRKVDRKIASIVRKNSTINYNTPNKSFNNKLDHILTQTLQIPNVTDAIFDHCRLKISIYPGWAVLGIVYWPTPALAIQKCYYIQLGNHTSRWNRYRLFMANHLGISMLKPKSDRLKLLPQKSFYKPDFVAQERTYCESQKQQSIYNINLK